MGPVHAAHTCNGRAEIGFAGWLSVAADADSDPPRDVFPSRELRCRFLRTALAQRITFRSELITLPGPVTVIARSALAFLDRLLDHHAQPLSRPQTSKTTFEAIPARLD
jgi:hypothetical protein